MNDRKEKSSWPRWHDISDLIAAPYLGAFICMLIAPLYVFSRKLRIEVDNDGATGGLAILLFIWIGIVLWSVALLIGTFTILKAVLA